MKNKKYLFLNLFVSFLLFNSVGLGAHIVITDCEEGPSPQQTTKRSIDIYFDGEDPGEEVIQGERGKQEESKKILQSEITSELISAVGRSTLLTDIPSPPPILRSIHFLGIANDDDLLAICGTYAELKENKLLHKETSFILWCKSGTVYSLQIDASNLSDQLTKEIRQANAKAPE